MITFYRRVHRSYYRTFEDVLRVDDSGPWPCLRNAELGYCETRQKLSLSPQFNNEEVKIITLEEEPFEDLLTSSHA